MSRSPGRVEPEPTRPVLRRLGIRADGYPETMLPSRDDPIVKEALASGALLLATVGVLLLGVVGSLAFLH